MADLRIDLAAEFKGKKAFKEAAKATSSLDKAVGKLGKQLASVFAASKVYQYGKASVKAFAEDEKAALSLARTVQNLGLGLATQGKQLNTYVSNLEQQTGVLDDELRPALDRLLRATFSITKAQELLNLALDISAGTGKSVTQVSQSLQKAYLGQTQALGRLGVGLSKVELTSSSFEEIQQRLTYLFAGQAKTAAASYAGQIDRLTIASNNAKETIGKGLVDALILATGKDKDVQDVADAMGNLSEFTADAVRGLGALAGQFTAVDKAVSGGLLGKLLSANFKYGLLGQLAALGQSTQERPRAGRRFMGGAQVNLYSQEAAAERKRLEQQKKLQAAQLKATKALTAEQKKQALLKKQAGVFDLEQIQLIAALQGNLSKEERTRLEAQLALLNGNEAAAASLTKQILMSQDATGQLYKLWQTLPDARNPFKYLEDYLEALAKKAALLLTGTAPVIGTNPNNGSWNGFNNNPSFPDTNVAPLPVSPPPAGGFGGSVMENYRLNQITVQIDGKAVASALQDSSMSGTASSVNRLTGGWSIS